MRFLLVSLIISLAGMALTEDQKQEPLWLAKVRVKCDDTIYHCLGAIVTEEFLITTASCIDKCDESERVIKILATELPAADDEPELYDVKLRATDVVVHPQYNTQSMNNVALVKFKCPEFQLAKVALNDSCMPEIDLSVMNLHVDEESVSCLMSAASMSDKKKKCKRAYGKYWDESMQSCIVASSCSDKSEALIANGHHDTLYGFSLSASQCDNKQENTIIAALELCRYYNWIMNMTVTDEQCKKKGTSAPPSTPRQIATTQPTTTTTSKPTTPPTTTPTKPTINCGAPPSIANGVVTSTGQEIGSKSTYQCNAGYEMKGDDTITCKRNGEWTKRVPSCKQQVTKSCSNPKPVRNANVEFSSVQEGSTAKYTCATRYGLVGDSKLTCRNGKWNGALPRCVDCPSLGTVAGGKLKVLLNLLTQWTVHITCTEGYTLIGEAVNHCLGGKWKYAKATCKINECPIPEDIPIGSVKYTTLTYGSVAVYSCPKDYIISGFQQRQCRADQTWTGSPPQCKLISKSFCKPYGRISCGSTSNKGGLSIGATVTYTPNANAQLMGPDMIKCLPNATWSAPTPTCRVMCPMSFNLENGDHKLIMDDSKSDYQMVMTCDEGYKMVGVKTFTCKNGLWSRTPSVTRCVADCTCLKVENAKVTCTENAFIYVATVQCKRGFKIKGVANAVCVKSLGRYLTTPSCERA